MKKLTTVLTLLPFAHLLLISCSSGENKSTVTDSTTTVDTADMPVVTPRVTDSSAVVKTPPVKDNNVIMPDSAIQ